MALTNCSISSTSINVTQGQAVSGAASQVLTITPDTGYCVSAADFTNNTNMSHADISAVLQGIAITNSHVTPYHENNTVLVTCDLKDTYVANVNKDLIIDIDGEALDIKGRTFSIAGTWDQVVNSNVTASTVTNANNNAYSITGYVNTYGFIIQQTYTCDSGYYFTAAPTVTKTTVGAYADNYNVTIAPIQWVDGLPTQYAVQTTVTIPEAFVTGHNLDVSANAVSAIPVQANLITGVVIEASELNSGGETRRLKIYGNEGASFRLFIRNDGASDPADKWYNFTTDLFTGTSESYSSNFVIDSSGIYEMDIIFPAQDVNPTETYFISVIGGTSPATNTTQGSDDNNDAFTQTLTQRDDISITLTASGTALNVATTAGGTDSIQNIPANSINLDDDGNMLGGDVKWDITVTSTTSGKVLHLTRQPVFSNEVAYDTSGNNDFTNTLAANNNGTIWQVNNLAATGDGTATIRIQTGTSTNSSGDIINGFFWDTSGTANVTSNLNLNNFIATNSPPVATSAPYSVNEEALLTIDLSQKATDADSDPLTYAIVSDNTGSNGTLTLTSATNGTVTYQSATNNNTNVTFTWKCNDGFEDSNTATASITVNPVNDQPTAIALSANTQPENTAINTTIGAFSTTDPDAGDTFTYTLVSGTGSTDNSSFNISGANLRNSAVFDYETKNSYSIRVRSTDAGGLYTEAQFTINVTDVTEGGARWLIERYDSSGNTTNVQYYVSATQYCNGSSLATIPNSCFGLNKYVRFVTSSGGCSSTVLAAGKIIDMSVANGAIGAYIHGSGAQWFNSAQDAHNNTNATTC